MSSSIPTPRARTPEQTVERLQNQINWVTRLSLALNSVSNSEDLISIVLAGLMSPTGLGYSQVLYFEHDVDMSILKGKYVLFHEDLRSIQELAEELESETSFMRSRTEIPIRGFSQAIQPTIPEEQIQHLSINAQWVTLFQKLHAENPRTEQLKHLKFSTRSSENKASQRQSILEEITKWHRPQPFSRANVGGRLPHAIINMLPEDFIIAPLQGREGLRGILIMDKHLNHPGPIDEQDIKEVGWFLRQAALAFDHVEMTTRLSEAYEEMKELEHLKSNFLATISHELRTPLTSMMGFVDLILQERFGPINEGQRQLLTRVARNNQHLNQLVNDLLELAEIESIGRDDIHPEAIEPLGPLMDAIARVETRRRDSDVQILPRVDQPLPKIYADEKAVERVLFHLLDNASKFSPPKATVDVTFRVLDGELAIDIADHGPGIDQRKLKDIFKTFYQVDGSLSRGHEGLGIGLTVVRMLLQVLHGRIEVSSEPGCGSTFTPIFRIDA